MQRWPARASPPVCLGQRRDTHCHVLSTCSSASSGHQQTTGPVLPEDAIPPDSTGFWRLPDLLLRSVCGRKGMLQWQAASFSLPPAGPPARPDQALQFGSGSSSPLLSVQLWGSLGGCLGVVLSSVCLFAWGFCNKFTILLKSSARETLTG